MDEVIARIVEIERQCSAQVEQARLEYTENIKNHKRILEEKKNGEFARIISDEKARLTKAVEEAKKQNALDYATLRQDNERVFQDKSLQEAVKEDIMSILLEG